MNYLNLQAGGRVASRSRAKLTVTDSLTPHMFRHTYATSGDIYITSKLMRRASVDITAKGLRSRNC